MLGREKVRGTWVYHSFPQSTDENPETQGEVTTLSHIASEQQSLSHWGGGSRRLGLVTTGVRSPGDPTGCWATGWLSRADTVYMAAGDLQGRACSLVPTAACPPNPAPPGPAALHTHCPFALPHFL